LIKAGGDARGSAARVLVRVWTTDAFAAAALDAELSRHPDMDPRDARLATELCYGVLRAQGALETKLAALTPKGKLSIDAPAVRAHLLIAAYTLCFLDRIPTFAAVNEAVTSIRAEGDARAASFANAVLRKLGDEVAAKGRTTLEEAASASAPGWLRGALRRTLGRSGAEAYLAAGPVPPPIGLCLRAGEDREAWIRRLQEAAPEGDFSAGKASPRAILVRGAGDVRRLPGANAAWIVQEEGAQMVALALGARPGEQVLDACAGRGNKTWLLGQEVAPGGAADAADLFPAKLAKLREGPVGGGVRSTFAVDWSSGTGEVPGNYDRVLVDAPCSGVGTLRRRPEIALRRTAEDVQRLSDLQVAIARNAATRVRDGGRLVVAVCSVLREEAEVVVERLLAEPGEGLVLSAAAFDVEPVQALSGEGATSLRLLPHVHGTDGYFVASFLVRRA
jgi:16S rRNA (cytosine967-C5)-methyltransferase